MEFRMKMAERFENDERFVNDNWTHGERTMNALWTVNASARWTVNAELWKVSEWWTHAERMVSEVWVNGERTVSERWAKAKMGK